MAPLPDVNVNVDMMENGETRARLMHRDGHGYILTIAPPEGPTAWQNAHKHRGVRETYVVQSGWMAFATQRGNEREVRVYWPGEVVTSLVDVDHNVFMPVGAVIHTVKHGVAVGNPMKNDADWFEAEQTFDQWTKSLTVKDIAVVASVPLSALMAS